MFVIKGTKDPKGECENGTFFYNIITSRIWIYLTKWIVLNLIPNKPLPLVIDNLDYYKRSDDYPQFKIDVTNTSAAAIKFSASQLYLFTDIPPFFPIFYMNFVDANISEVSVNSGDTITLDLRVMRSDIETPNLYGSSLLISERIQPYKTLGISDPFQY